MQTRSGEKLSLPRPCEALAKGYRRESKDLRWGTKSAINYVHLLISGKKILIGNQLGTN